MKRNNYKKTANPYSTGVLKKGETAAEDEATNELVVEGFVVDSEAISVWAAHKFLRKIKRIAAIKLAKIDWLGVDIFSFLLPKQRNNS